MDQKIVAVFYEVQPKNDAVPDFDAALNSVYARGVEPGERELQISEDVTVRLERLNSHGDWMEGEMTRIQVDNIPHEALPHGLQPSRAESQGHSAVFRYNRRLRVLVMQRNLSGMTVNRLFRYLRVHDEVARYDVDPIPNLNVWERFGRKKPRRFSLTLASIRDPEIAEGPVGAITDSSRRMGQALESPTIHMSFSAGGRDEGLNKSALREIVEFFTGSESEEYEVTSLSVSGVDEENDASEVINFLDDILKEDDKIMLNGLDSEESFSSRIVFLRDCFAAHMDYIASQYGPD